MFDNLEASTERNQPIAPDQFDDHFAAAEVRTSIMFERVLRLRHQVYCIEKKFESTDPGGGLETDDYDANAIHAALIHTGSRELAGCFRLIRPMRRDSLAGTPLFDQYAEKLFEDADGLPAHAVAEISRFAISKDFRNRRIAALREAHALGAMTSSDEIERRLLPHLTLGLMRSVYMLSQRSAITHLTALIDASLLRHMGRFGLKFDIIGPPIFHKGWRYPVVSEIAENQRLVAVRRPDVWNMIRAEIAEPMLSAA